MLSLVASTSILCLICLMLMGEKMTSGVRTQAFPVSCQRTARRSYCTTDPHNLLLVSDLLPTVCADGDVVSGEHNVVG